jgi:Arc/MetJ-type ribon-helix-helix transcriptional regulator
MSADGDSGYARITVSMPRDLLEGVRAAVGAGAASSVSALVASAVQRDLDRTEALRRIDALIGPDGLPDEATDWARSALGLPPQDAAAPRGSTAGRLAS